MAPIKLKLFGIQITSNNDGCPFTPTPQEVSVVVTTSSVDGNLEKEESMEMSTVPCLHCHSPNTKFCYFNNYNTNQPRHFCKDCQRYWTVGGALRNLPQGSGCCKKTKPTLSTISETAVSAEFLKSSPTTVVPPNNQSLYRHIIRLPPPPSPREALPEISTDERLGASESSQEPIDPSAFCFPVGPCLNIGYGYEGKGGHETRPWTTLPCSAPIAKAPLLGKHPQERSETAENSSTCSTAKLSRIQGPQEDAWSSISSMALGPEENRPDSPVSTAGIGGNFNGFPLKFEEPFVQAFNGDLVAAMNRSISFQQGSGNSRSAL